MRKPETIAREIADVEKLTASAQAFSVRFPDDDYLRLNLQEYAYRRQRLAEELRKSLAARRSLPKTSEIGRYRMHLQLIQKVKNWTNQELATHLQVSEDFLLQLLDGQFDELLVSASTASTETLDFTLFDTTVAIALATPPASAARQPAPAKAVYHPRFDRAAPSVTLDLDCVYG